MKLLYAYNEVLPKRSAHDVYIWRSCVEIAKALDPPSQITLAIGRSSISDSTLHTHYQTEASASFGVQRLWMMRKSFGLPFTINRVFLQTTQSYIKHHRPDWVLLSVRKQGLFHLARRIDQVRYCYEVHELLYYPNLGDVAQLSTKRQAAIRAEAAMLAACDCVTVTTQALANILKQAPYSLPASKIAVVPLAAKSDVCLSTLPASSGAFTLGYVGQLYQGQGIEQLLAALAKTPQHIKLKVIGGSPEDIAKHQAHAAQYGIDDRVRWLGFQPPQKLLSLVQDVPAFVAPFTATTRMPYVAHTKLVDYTGWGRPFIAPAMPVVIEEFAALPRAQWGCEIFTPDSAESLADAIQALAQPERYSQLASNAAQAHWRAQAMGWSERVSRLLKALRHA
jgi:glycosyltransferase involved in cell wall biosynthesis